MFWVKKLVSMLVMPIPFILVLLVIVLFTSQTKWLAKGLLGISVVLLLFFSSNWGMRSIVVPLESQYGMNSTAIEGECIVLVLGSGHDLSPSFNPIERLSPAALKRLSEGLRQLRLGNNCKLVTSGWSGKDNMPTESSHAYVAAQAAKMLGVKETNILMQDQARDTIEEAQYFKQRFGDKPFRLVTSATHMPRAMAIFKQYGLSPQAAPADYIGAKASWWRITAHNIYKCRRAIHEYLGISWLEVKHFLAL